MIRNVDMKNKMKKYLYKNCMENLINREISKLYLANFLTIIKKIALILENMETLKKKCLKEINSIQKRLKQTQQM